MKAIEQYFHVALFIVRLVQTFKCVGEIQVCDHSNESYRALLLCDTVYCARQEGSAINKLWMNPNMWLFIPDERY